MKARDILTRFSALPPQWDNILAWYRGDIADGRLIAYRPTGSSTPQVKGSLFSVAVPEDVALTGLLTTDVITVGGGTAPTCAVNGTLSMTADFWDMRVHRAGVLWAYLPGINVGGAFELDASGNGHTLYLTTTTITERTDGTGTNYKNVNGFASCVAAPDGFTWPAAFPAINIHVDGNGVATAPGYDISAGRPTGKAYYVKYPGGSDLNDGLTMETALASIATALQKADAVEIYVQSGVYPRNKSWQTVQPLNDLSVIAVGGPVVSTYHDALTWAPDATYPTVSKATRSTVYQVRDGSVVDSKGDAEKLTLRASVEEVSLNPGSYYTDNVSVWVLPSDSRTADANCWCLMSGGNGRVSGKSIYVEGFTFLGGNCFKALNTAAEYTLVQMKNCTFKYAFYSNAGGFATTGNVASILENCVGACSEYDGFNYHASTTYIPAALEINCTSRNNGTYGVDETMNGSSMHDAGTVIRVGGSYHGNRGPNVVDVNDALSWNIGVSAHDSTALVNNADFFIDGSMWVHSCTGNIFTEQTAGDTMYAYDTTTTGATSTPYTPTAGLAIPIIFGGPLTTPGPLNVSATITAGTVYPAVTIKAPLGPKFQAIPEWTGEAAVDLSTLSATARTRIGPRGMLIYGVDLSAADQARADGYLGVS